VLDLSSPLAGIGARLSAKSNWGRVCVPSPLAGEGEDGGETGRGDHRIKIHVADLASQPLME